MTINIVINPIPLSAPTITSITTASTSSVIVSFTSPTSTGGIPIIQYTAISSPSSITASSASSPITVTGLTAGQSYTFTVTAYNGFGPGPSATTPSIVTTTPVSPPGSQSYTTPGTYTWIASTGVNSVSVFVVGGGSGGYAPFRNSFRCGRQTLQQYYNGYGGSGGGTYFENNMAVTPGTSYTVVVGSGGAGGIFNSAFNSNCYQPSSGGTSYFCSICRASASGGWGSSPGAGFSTSPGASCRSSLGGGIATLGWGNSWIGGGGGGGVGLLGNTSNASGAGGSGAGGSNGVQVCGNAPGGAGGLYGGGGGGGYAFGTSTGQNGGVGAGGAVRIVWPGSTRQFPSTCVGTP